MTEKLSPAQKVGKAQNDLQDALEACGWDVNRKSYEYAVWAVNPVDESKIRGTFFRVDYSGQIVIGIIDGCAPEFNQVYRPLITQSHETLGKALEFALKFDLSIQLLGA